MKTSLLLSLTILLISIAIDTLAEPHVKWLDRNSEGWFWYESDINKPSQRDNKSLTTKWIRENIQHYLDKAIDNPSHENITQYLMLQKEAMDKAFLFMDNVQTVTIGNPQLDEIRRRPSATYANIELDRQATENLKHTLHTISQYLGIFLFIDGTNVSYKQKQIMDMLIDNYKFDSITITNETLSPQMHFSKTIRKDTGQINAMGITTLPAIALIKGNGEYDIISQGAVSYPDLEKRILIGAKRLKIIDQKTFNRTRSVNHSTTKFDVHHHLKQ
ncbi:MAG: conjugal transfer protein TraF [Candidatus Thiodiazotropha endolucinida]|nr:conjugal transfer protein TraF [Candidatus Thiodiazotropha taylori]MCW4225200.1 conjugal transfer protein TraF [Candidatus Thiodiazotropha endolucinida]MCG7880752.1 conjugal transfer protein TraF [Candidatus Thiodiazotropha taylori]MCG7886771.1 conjugal transfer protein TraF [Candidatus Thiodiazotropha taylori]MCG8028159.1 conjugal transfer protein TraF [Candidatus Thiodiazotropha taylori]